MSGEGMIPNNKEKMMRTRLLVAIGTIAVFALGGLANANLLTNGDFALGSDGTTAPDTVAFGWDEWNGGGWNNREANAFGIGGDTNNYYKALGNSGRTDQGIFQVVPATEGLEYKASVDSGDPDGWWFANGDIKIDFMAADDSILGSSNEHWTHVAGDTPLPWANYSTTAVAPLGTTQIKVLLMNQGNDPENEWAYGGTMRFDNAVLEVVPEPATLGLFGVAGLMLWIRRKLKVQ